MYCDSINKVKAATIAPCKIMETLLKKKSFEDGNMIKEWEVIHYLLNLKIKQKYATQLTRLIDIKVLSIEKQNVCLMT
jgi:hypothetical protein